ncbi:hypothetical protein CR513_35021, partial [Mucuna pruriens]
MTRQGQRTTTDETPFRLASETNAMILVKVGEPSIWRNDFRPDDNLNAIRTDLDLIEEVREQAFIRQETCRQRVARRYKSKVKPRDFREEDLVWRKTREARKKKEDDNNDVYRLENLDNTPISRIWNAMHLKFYFS